MYVSPDLTLTEDHAGNLYLPILADTPQVPVKTNAFLATKLDRDGRVLWKSRPENLERQPFSMFGPTIFPTASAVDSHDHLILSGPSSEDATAGPFAKDILVAKVSPDGDEIWSTKHSMNTDLVATYSILTDQKDRVLVSVSGSNLETLQVYSGTVQYGPDGKENWTAGLPAWGVSAASSALDSQGNLFLSMVGFQGFGGAGNYLLAKFDPSGRQLWLARSALEGLAKTTYARSQIRIRDDGDIVVDGYSGIVPTEQSGGSAISNSYRATFKQNLAPGLPVFLGRPTAQRVGAGDRVVFSPLVQGDQPLNMQWYSNGLPLAGEVSTVLTIPSARIGDAGSYSLLALNGSGCAFSEDLNLLVLEKPLMIVKPVEPHASSPDLHTLPLEVRGQPSRYYEVSSSADLIEWKSFASVQTSTNGAGMLYAIVPNGSSRRYFRASPW